jgi:hypothetical protein
MNISRYFHGGNSWKLAQIFRQWKHVRFLVGSTIVPSKLRNDRFFRRFASTSFPGLFPFCHWEGGKRPWHRAVTWLSTPRYSGCNKLLEIHACNNPSPVFKRCMLSAVASTSSQGVCEVR